MKLLSRLKSPKAMEFKIITAKMIFEMKADSKKPFNMTPLIHTKTHALQSSLL